MRRFAIACFLLGLMPLLSGCIHTFGGSCLVEGTSVLTPAGEVPVESLHMGDAVVARDGRGDLVRAEVVATRSARAERIVRIELSNGRALEVTPEHPIYVRGSWRKAGSLEAGDRGSGTDGEIEVVRVEHLTRACEVFDLTVEPGSCFFASGLLVHNKTVPLMPRFAELRGDWVASSYGEFIAMRISEDGEILLGVAKGLLSARMEPEYGGRAPRGEQSLRLTRPGGGEVLATAKVQVLGRERIDLVLSMPPGSYGWQYSFLPWEAAGKYLESVDWQSTGAPGNGG